MIKHENQDFCALPLFIFENEFGCHLWMMWKLHLIDKVPVIYDLDVSNILQMS